jgi:hypothetical protein
LLLRLLPLLLPLLLPRLLLPLLLPLLLRPAAALACGRGERSVGGGSC